MVYRTNQTRLHSVKSVFFVSAVRWGPSVDHACSVLHLSSLAVFKPVFLCTTCLFLSSKLNFIWSFGKTFTPKKEKLQEADGERGRGCSKRNDNLITTTLHWLGACWGNLLCQALSIEARLSERTKRFTFFLCKGNKKKWHAFMISFKSKAK